MVGGERAARVEQAAGRPVEHAGHDAGDGRQQARRGALRQGRQQGRGVGVHGVGEQALHTLRLDLLAGILDHDPVDGLGDHAHVVGDQDQRHAALALQVEQQVEDLRLDGDVERRGRLVGDQQLGVAGDRHGDHHPLAHAARELVREGAEPVLRRGDADEVQQLQRPGAGRLAVHALVEAQGLGELELDGEAGVQGAHRLLEDHRHVLADQIAALARAELQQGLALEVQPVGGDPGGPGQKAHDRQHGDALARAALADDAHDLAGVDGEVDAVHGAERAEGGLELRPRGSGSRARVPPWRSAPLQLGVERVAQAVAHEVEGEHGDQDGEAREGHHPPGAQDELARVGQHGAPFGRRRLGAEAEEAQGRGVEDGVGEARASTGRSAAPSSWAGRC